MQGTQYATKRNILCRGAFCGPTKQVINARTQKLKVHYRAAERSLGNVSDCRYMYVSDCRLRGREFDPGPVPYFCGD